MPTFDPSRIDVEDFLDCLEVRNLSKATEREWRFSCPLPSHEGTDESPSCYMNDGTTAFFCHGCKGKGNAIHFTEQTLGVSRLEAIRMLRERYAPGSINPDARGMVQEVRKIWTPPDNEGEQPLLPETLIERYALRWDEAYYHWENGNGHPATDYMLERGFDPLALDTWEFGYDETSDRVTFAVRDEQGRLVGFKARAHDGRHPKYLVLGDGGGKAAARYGYERYFPSRVVFGAHRVEPGSEVIVCEGELNAVAVRSCTGLPAVAINGSHFTGEQAMILRKIASKVTLYLDDDDAGLRAVWGWEDSEGRWHPGIVEMLPGMPVEMVPEHQMDAAEYQEKDQIGVLKELIGDAESVFRRQLRSQHLPDRSAKIPAYAAGT